MTIKKNFCTKCTIWHAVSTGKTCQQICEICKNGGQSGKGTISNGSGLHVRSHNEQKRPDDAGHLAPAVVVMMIAVEGPFLWDERQDKNGSG